MRLERGAREVETSAVELEIELGILRKREEEVTKNNAKFCPEVKKAKDKGQFRVENGERPVNKRVGFATVMVVRLKGLVATVKVWALPKENISRSGR